MSSAAFDNPAVFIRVFVLDATQEEMAKRLNMSQANVSYFEKEHGKIPENYRPPVKKWAKELGKRIPDEWFEKVPTMIA